MKGLKVSSEEFGSPEVTITTPRAILTASQQGCVGESGGNVYYQDGCGRMATLSDLTPTEIQVLQQKHFGE